MFTSERRERLRSDLIERARLDPAVIAAATVGSGARDELDAWSDIDLALRLAPGLMPIDVAAVWTRTLGDLVGPVDHVDVWSGPALYRVFFLPDSLQVDVSFWPDDGFTATSTSFDLLFGEFNPPVPMPAPSPNALIGMGWLYAIHVRSAIARGRPWQAAHLMDRTREHVVALACLRHGLSWREGRGTDDLPADVLAALDATFVASLDAADLHRAFSAVVDLLLAEARHVDAALATRLEGPLRILVETVLESEHWRTS